MEPPVVRRRLGLYATLAAVAVLSVVMMATGGWWAPFVFGLAIGLLAVARARIAIPLGAAAGLIAWGVPLVVDQASFGIGPAASALAAILGFGRRGVLGVVLTLLIGSLLGLTGAWLGSAVRAAVLVSPRARETAPRSPRKG